MRGDVEYLPLVPAADCRGLALACLGFWIVASVGIVGALNGGVSAIYTDPPTSSVQPRAKFTPMLQEF